MSGTDKKSGGKSGVNVYLETELRDRLVEKVQSIRGLSLSRVGELAITRWVEQAEADKVVLRTLDAVTIKPPGAPFPPRQAKHIRGRAIGSKTANKSYKQQKFYVPIGLADRFDAAVWWLGLQPSRALEDALRRWVDHLDAIEDADA